MHRHPLDPPAPYRAAPRLARLIAAGLLDYPECLAALLQAGQIHPALPSGPLPSGPLPSGPLPSGLRTRLAHALGDAVAEWTRRRVHAMRAIRAILAPLLAAHAPAAQLLGAAWAENRAHATPLRAAEVQHLARAEAARQQAQH